MPAWIGRIFIGLLITILGFSMVWKTTFYLSMIGSIAWADRNLGGGGSRLFYKLFGIVIILLGFIIITDLFDNIMIRLVGGLFGV